ncbi:MAG: hypothetical protein AB203_03735 [Parcubacteria bacterium C7867-008]|nr:MAG: hypothetical protein AB203_03735 [Parcubacteria bacterium C7867-008]
MKVVVLGMVAALVFSAGAAYLVFVPNSQKPIPIATLTAAAGSTIYDTSSIVELFRQLFVLQQKVKELQPPLATTTIPFAPNVGTTTTSKKAPVKAVKPVAPKVVAPVNTETKLGLALPKLRSAIVNIVCIPNKAGTGLRGISGTGVIIDSRGIILTVAHVAQYELIAAARPDLLTCVVRTGSPAASAYFAKPIYVSQDWIDRNSKLLSSSDPRGTGEDDFALLAITETATKTPLPASFPSVSLANNTPTLKQGVVIGSYGAEFLSTETIRSGIFPTLVFASVKDRLTFGSQMVDLISLGGGAAAQEGSSGGGAVNEDAQLVGLITSRSNAANLNDRDLRAITNTYLQSAFREETGESIDSFLSTDRKSLVSDYASDATKLGAMLVKVNRITNQVSISTPTGL